MEGVHPLADLAPRDVVAKAITRRMHESGMPHMWLDARHLGGDFWERRFPTILATARLHGVDPVDRADARSRPPSTTPRAASPPTSGAAPAVPGLYATGEVACSGVHGANRLASNSLLEGLVFSRRIAEVLPDELRPWNDPVADPRAPGLVPGSAAAAAAGADDRRVGVLRSEKGLAAAVTDLDVLAGEGDREPGPDAWETSNLLTVSRALAAAAALREETRGSHWREDHPERDDDHWAGHVDVALEHGRPVTTFRPAPATDGGPA